jgi:hypothetical protein
MAGVIFEKVRGSALLEVLVAITILMTVVVVGSIIFVNVTGSSFTGQKIKAGLIIDKYSLETQKNKAFFDEDIKEENIVIKKKVEKYNGSDNLLIISIQALDEGQKVLAEKREIVVVNNEKN